MQDDDRDHCKWRAARRERGLMLIELMVTLTIAAVLLGIGVPAFGQILAQNRLSTSSNQLLRALVIARQTAVSHNVAVAFCAGNPIAGCHGDWTQREWIVFVDADRDGQLDSEERVKLADHLQLAGSISITGNGPFQSAIVFRPNGLARTRSGAFAAGRLRVCTPKSISENARDLVLIGSGRIEPEPHDFAGSCPAAGR